MQPAIHVTTRVLPGGKIEISAPELDEGQSVEVFVVMPEAFSASARSALDIIESLKGHRQFATPSEVDQHVDEERDSWDR